MSMKNKLNEEIGLSYIVENVSEIAYTMVKEVRLKEFRFNEKSLLKEDLQYECENFLYDSKKYPEISVDKRLLVHEDIILKYFDKVSVFIEETEMIHYVSKEDDKILLFVDPLTEDLKLRYDNNFITEKTNLGFKSDGDIRKTEVSNFLLTEDTICEVADLSYILENFKVENVSEEENSLFQEYTLSYVKNNYEDLKELKEDCEIAYNEIINEGRILPILTYIDILTEEISAMYIIKCEQSYKNHYKCVLDTIYEA